jgi:hypothetical protein
MKRNQKKMGEMPSTSLPKTPRAEANKLGTSASTASLSFKWITPSRPISEFVIATDLPNYVKI